MGNEVYANMMEVSCKAAAGKSICAFPDVCFTPPQTPATPPGVPIPYPNTGMASDCASGSSTVKISGQEVMLKNKSYFKKSTGDEAGCAPKKGLVNSQNRGKIYFKAWSFDVKVEGENVVRNLDIATHNHASDIGNESIPWPYIDKASISEDHACVKSGDVQKVNDNCTDPPEDCNTKECCEARRCMLVPGDLGNNKCCKSGRKKMTPHHIIPAADHYTTTGIRAKVDKNKISRAQAQKHMRPGNKTYDQKAAPSICVQGRDHQVRSQHGKIGRAYAHMRDKVPGGDTYSYSDVAAPAAQIVGYHTGCDPDCIKAQMDAYHGTRSSGPLTRSRQAKKGGETPYRKAIPNEEEFFGPS
jgi:hypothetical protein